ncbi:MAG: surfeit locus 1 family protein [Verrucomicrobiaceae bacterium]|nr:surfeit locus 1 family protein [Verrucomicrobiaceae bacterium]
MTSARRDAEQPRGTGWLIALALLFSLVFIGLTALGTWQIERRTWKLDLIERVESRIAAAPTDIPEPERWPAINAAQDEYKHVRLSGHFLPDRDTRVQALTALGAGFWILSPFQTDDGYVVLINRGFAPIDWNGDTVSSAPTEVAGLLRLSEPNGAFLRHNDPAAARWYSRDVQAIAGARGLQMVAPYFVDADRSAIEAESTWPRAGLTVTHFSNNHLGYALTWFALAAMVGYGGWRVARQEYRLRRGDPDPNSAHSGRTHRPLL